VPRLRRARAAVRSHTPDTVRMSTERTSAHDGASHMRCVRARFGSDSTRERTDISGIIASHRHAAVSTMRAAPRDAQQPRPLHEDATTSSWPVSSRCTRASRTHAFGVTSSHDTLRGASTRGGGIAVRVAPPCAAPQGRNAVGTAASPTA